MTLRAPATPPRLWLARHGETEWSSLGRHTGRTDVPLTERGEVQARALGAALAGQAFDQVLASPRRRALDTCRLAGFGDRCVVDDDLREWDYGADEGRTTPEIQLDRPGWSIWRDGPLDGETLDHVARRADHLVARVRAAEGDVLCIAHGHLLRVVAARWLGLPPEDGRLCLLEPATVSILGSDRGTAVIELWNRPS